MSVVRHDILNPIRGYAPPEALHCRFTVIGLGALGSNVARRLAQIGARYFTLYDPDRVEPRNLALQDFGCSNVGMHKVDALARRLESDYSAYQLEITPAASSYTCQPLTDIVIAVPDNIDARRAIWQEASASDHAMLLIDGRTHRSSAQIFTIRPSHPDDAAYYAGKLAHTLPAAGCSDPLLQPIVASLVVQQALKWSQGVPYHRAVYLSLGEIPTIDLVDLVTPW